QIIYFLMLLACVPAVIDSKLEHSTLRHALEQTLCFKLVNFDGKQGKVDYQVKFASRLSDVQTSIDSDPICEEPEANVNKCQWRIPNHGFDM
ncbi:6316_t:CDS:2, partial [Funneliformis mosseae]